MPTDPEPLFRLVTISDLDGRPAAGLSVREGVLRLGDALDRLGEAAPAGLASRSLVGLLARGAATVDAVREVVEVLRRKGDLETLVDAEAVLLLPLRPGKVVAVGRNYAAHAKELGNAVPEEPFFFGKAPSSAVGPGEAIEIPADYEGEVHHEAELALVVGRRGRRIPEDRAAEWIAGWTCANDVTARTLQKSLQERRLPWFSGKNADTFLPLGPGIVPAALVADASALRIRCTVDGVVRQDGTTADMIHGPAALLARASRHLTMEPGDVILTGTPSGVGPLSPGQVVEVFIEGVGTLRNPVRAERGA
jgi:2-keto-4-pentenoate hydratase/2-oxohepta-3-ene-1,7-dioic acid hydratase in catechol pathway